MQRNPRTDHLLTPENAALILIDYQPAFVDGTHSISRENLVNNVVAISKAAKMLDMPILLSTIGVEAGWRQDTIPELRAVLSGIARLDRNKTNAWESAHFRTAVQATGRKKLIMAALWTEVCLVLPSLDLIKEGYEVYALSDVSGGSTVDAHNRAMQRLIQAGAIPITWAAVMAESARLGRYDNGSYVAIMNEHLPKSRPGPLVSVAAQTP